MQRMRDKIRTLIGRETRVPVSEKVARLNPALRGWGAYFSWLNAARHFRLIDRYVEYKLRRWLRISISAGIARSGERPAPSGKRPASAHRAGK
jgi:hypothetical protein